MRASRRLTDLQWRWEMKQRAPLGWAVASFNPCDRSVVLAPAPLAVFAQLWQRWRDHSFAFVLTNRVAVKGLR